MTARRLIFGIVLGVGAALGSASLKPTFRIVYNPSGSAPRGWYLVVPAADLHVGDYVVARLSRLLPKYRIVHAAKTVKTLWAHTLADVCPALE
ncbi:MAG TPA: hypothetical protein VKG21_17705 [Casimicrobiaceae bacterium]|nr:hypothetical protein [Casimicrobiaceae bacterium]